jgi:oligoribonuclease NrnB/cAMP/cGMP phosphodiesterase (DHH superfamily)
LRWCISVAAVEGFLLLRLDVTEALDLAGFKRLVAELTGEIQRLERGISRPETELRKQLVKVLQSTPCWEADMPKLAQMHQEMRKLERERDQTEGQRINKMKHDISMGKRTVEQLREEIKRLTREKDDAVKQLATEKELTMEQDATIARLKDALAVNAQIITGLLLEKEEAQAQALACNQQPGAPMEE